MHPEWVPEDFPVHGKRARRCLRVMERQLFSLRFAPPARTLCLALREFMCCVCVRAGGVLWLPLGTPDIHEWVWDV